MRRYLLVFAVMSIPPAFADTPDPVEINVPASGELIALGEQRIEIKPTPYLNANKYECAVSQGKATWKSATLDYPICELSVADQGRFKPGPAKITVRVKLGARWLPAKTIDVELTGTEAPSAESDTPLRGGGVTYKLTPRNSDTPVKVAVAVGADKWKVLRPGDVSASYITFHHGNDERADATVYAATCDNPDPTECVSFGLETQLKVYVSAPEAKLTPNGPNRTVGTTSWSKEMRDKRTNTSGVVNWYGGGVSEFDPATKAVLTCGVAATRSEAHLRQVLRFCATMKLVR